MSPQTGIPHTFYGIELITTNNSNSFEIGLCLWLHHTALPDSNEKGAKMLLCREGLFCFCSYLAHVLCRVSSSIKFRAFSSWEQVIPVFPGFNMDLVQPSIAIQLLLNFLVFMQKFLG